MIKEFFMIEEIEAMNPRTKIVVAILGAIVIAVLLITGGSNDKSVVADTPRLGAPSVYARIDSMFSCSGLRAEFDDAHSIYKARARLGQWDRADIYMSYMEATDDRMTEIGCY